MRIWFERAGERRVRITVERDDGALLEIRSPDASREIPHDLVHYVVEAELGLPEGFWGKIARGVVFDSVRVVRAPIRRTARPRRKRRRLPPRQLLEAEVLVEIFLKSWDGSAVEEYGSVRAYLDATWSPRTRSRADEIDPATIDRVSARLDEISRRWQALPKGRALELDWPPPRSEVARERAGRPGTTPRSKRPA